MDQCQGDQLQDKTIFSFIEENKPHKCYHITNKRTGQSLTQGPEVSACPLSQTNIRQLWTLQKHKDNFTSIVSFGSGTVLTRNSSGQNLACEKFKSRENQLWKIQFAYEDQKQKTKYFWISSKFSDQDCIFSTYNSPNLRLLKLDRTLFASLWRIQEVNQNDNKFGFCQIRLAASNLLLQAPDCSIKEQKSIMQSREQGKGSQKWIIQKLFKSYVIRNLCSGLVISIGQQVKQNFPILNILGNSPKNCRKIIQQVFQNSDNQKWNLIKINQNEFYFQSAADPDKFLGCLNHRQKVPVYLLGHQNFGEQMRNILWMVRGALPQAALKQKVLDITQPTKKQ